jgi:hypothetical protein
MITKQKLNLVEGRWTEELPNPDNLRIMAGRATRLNCHPGVLALLRLHNGMKSNRPVARALNLMGLDKQIVEEITKDIEPIKHEWTITRCQWDTPYVIKGQATWYNSYRRPPDKKIKTNFPAWKFENTTTGKFLILAAKKDIPKQLSRRIINDELAVVVTGSYSLDDSVGVIRRFFNV